MGKAAESGKKSMGVWLAFDHKQTNRQTEKKTNTFEHPQPKRLAPCDLRYYRTLGHFDSNL